MTGVPVQGGGGGGRGLVACCAVVPMRPIEIRTFELLTQTYRFVDANDGSLCLVTELCEGGNLQEVRCYLLVAAALSRAAGAYCL